MYTHGTYITSPTGNNAFSYDQRIALGSTGRIYVPSLMTGTLADLEVGSEICFEEVVDGKLISCNGLKHFVHMKYKGKDIFIVDNHNHVLSFRWKRLNASTLKRLNVIHIDQHADTKENNNICPPFAKEGVSTKWVEDLENFVNQETNVGNFISAAINSGIIHGVIQVRTDHALQETLHSTFGTLHYILDIDIDFREDKEDNERDFEIVRKLIEKAEFVTIATSPYFMDQAKAIEIIKKILV